MRSLIFPIAIIIGATIGSTGSTKAETGLTFKVGLGYEFLSQEFFLDSLVSSGADSLAARTELRTTYLDDFKGQITLNYLPHGDYRFEMRSVLEQTPDQSRIRLTTDFRPRLGAIKLEWNSEIEWRDGPVDSVNGDPGYLSGNGRAKLVLPVSKSLSLWGQARSDFVRFDSAGYGTFDYHRFGGQFGMSQRLSSFSSLTLNLFVMNREVPDTTDQDYLSYGLDGSVFGFYDQGEVDAIGRYETRDYDRVGDLGDYCRFAISVRNRHNIRGAVCACEELEIETIR